MRILKPKNRTSVVGCTLTPVSDHTGIQMIVEASHYVRFPLIFGLWFFH